MGGCVLANSISTFSIGQCLMSVIESTFSHSYDLTLSGDFFLIKGCSEALYVQSSGRRIKKVEWHNIFFKVFIFIFFGFA